MRPDIDIYLNVDGVLLDENSRPANYSREFIKYIVSNFNTYWLSSRSKDGNFVIIKELSKIFEPKIVELIGQVRPTRWSFAKTQAIDFSRPFLWFDDELVIHERLELISNNALESWIEVNLAKDENRLADFLVRFPQPANYVFF
ncbi:MAG TPA: hypothetical protein VI336_03425 [Candidatus Saccharimonadales bacterium]|nr:hypothetical protein [Candidatus Saccharimonadales bacterium]